MKLRNQGESVGIIGKAGEFRGNSGGNSGEIGESCFPNGETEFPDGEIDFPQIGEKGGGDGKLFHKNSHLGNLCETGGGNERELSPQVSIAQYCIPPKNRWMYE